MVQGPDIGLNIDFTYNAKRQGRLIESYSVYAKETRRHQIVYQSLSQEPEGLFVRHTIPDLPPAGYVITVRLRMADELGSKLVQDIRITVK